MVGRLFRNRNRPRVSLDLKVGSSHVLEVLLHLRRSDWDWYRSNEDAIEEELLELLEESVLSRMFGTEIEDYHRKHNPQIFPAEKVGTKSSKSSGSNQSNNVRKKHRKGSKAAIAAERKEKAAAAAAEEAKKVQKDVYYAFGELLQLAYRKQDLPAWNQGSRTLFINNVEEESFTDHPKLPARLLVWCSRINAESKTNPDPEDVGFYREEMIPISSLFREPQDE